MNGKEIHSWEPLVPKDAMKDVNISKTQGNNEMSFLWGIKLTYIWYRFTSLFSSDSDLISIIFL